MKILQILIENKLNRTHVCNYKDKFKQILTRVSTAKFGGLLITKKKYFSYFWKAIFKKFFFFA